MENITMPQEPLPLAEATSGSSDNETISKSYKCALCPSMFSQKSHLTTHVDSVHLKKKNYFCDKCDYASTRKGTLEKHIQAVHDKIKPFTCEVCSQKFNQKVHMNAHYDAIHLKRKLQCPDCDYAASREGALDKHIMVVHEKIKSFFCDVCGLAFGQKSHLNNHVEANI